MKIKHYIAPRSCGKTTFARNLQKEDPSLLLIERDCELFDLEVFCKNMRGRFDSRNCYTGIIIDEFLPITNQRSYTKARFLSELRLMGIKELYLISTPDKLYDSIKNEYEMISKFLIEQPNLEIIKTDFGRNFTKKEKEDMTRMIGIEHAKTNIEGEFLL